MLVIEGSDHLGKSSLVAAIADKLEELAGVRPEICAMTKEDGARTPSEYISLVKPWTIYDRFHLSEHVYGTVIEGREPRIGPSGCRIVSAAIEAAGGKIIIVDANSDYDKVAKLGNWEAHNQLFDQDTCKKADFHFSCLQSPFINPTNCSRVRVTCNKTRRGVDWPSSRDYLVHSIAEQYMKGQQALGHGMPPNIDEYRAQRGLPDWANGGVLAMKEARKSLIAGVMEAFVGAADVDPSMWRLIETGSVLPDNAGYKREWSFEQRPEGDAGDIQEASQES